MRTAGGPRFDPGPREERYGARANASKGRVAQLAALS